MSRMLVIQTAFAGDLILTLPLVQEARRLFPDARIDVLCIPSTADILRGHPDIASVIVHDKKGGAPLLPLLRTVRAARYDVCLCPHRSLRSAIIASASAAPVRVGFDRSAGRPVFTHSARYDAAVHDVRRNLSLLAMLTDGVDPDCRPRVFPSSDDRVSIETALRERFGEKDIICIAPGSVWETKRWTVRGFTETARAFVHRYGIVLVGGADDRDRCDAIAAGLPGDSVWNAAGSLGFLQSAALIGTARVLVSNDSAPVHLASAAGTPVVEIYGATSPAFGFAPFGVPHVIVERHDLACKPCAIHGGRRCPVRTFACMEGLGADAVIAAVCRLLDAGGA